jgi:hypothetical protein
MTVLINSGRDLSALSAVESPVLALEIVAESACSVGHDGIEVECETALCFAVQAVTIRTRAAILEFTKVHPGMKQAAA